MLDQLASRIRVKSPNRGTPLGIRLSSSSTIELTNPPWLRQADRRMTALMSLATGWDGEGSKPLSCECALQAWSFLLPNIVHDTPAPQIVPTFTGGLQLEWHLNGIDLELRFDPEEPACFYYSSDKIELEGEIADEVSLVGSYLRALPTRNEFFHPSR